MDEASLPGRTSDQTAVGEARCSSLPASWSI